MNILPLEIWHVVEYVKINPLTAEAICFWCSLKTIRKQSTAITTYRERMGVRREIQAMVWLFMQETV